MLLLTTVHSHNQPILEHITQIPLTYGLLESIEMLKEEGIDNAIARHARLAEGTRRCVKAWGLDLLCEEERWNSNSLTVVKTPENLNSTNLVRTAYSKYNLTIGLGLTEVAGKVFRIGHLGNMNETMLLGALSGTEMTLLDCGVKIEAGKGVGEAVKYFQQTSGIIPTREMEGVAA
jgi:alanine-glyoxylate transaminase/serine-glyoxylate transaminase/serine-pyruvate transaminase